MDSKNLASALRQTINTIAQRNGVTWDWHESCFHGGGNEVAQVMQADAELNRAIRNLVHLCPGHFAQICKEV